MNNKLLKYEFNIIKDIPISIDIFGIDNSFHDTIHACCGDMFFSWNCDDY